jgi:hypothetical protein
MSWKTEYDVDVSYLHDLSTNVKTPNANIVLKKELSKVYQKNEGVPARKRSKDWAKVLENCKSEYFDEKTKEKILEAANIFDEGPFDIFTIIWRD